MKRTRRQLLLRGGLPSPVQACRPVRQPTVPAERGRSTREAPRIRRLPRGSARTPPAGTQSAGNRPAGAAGRRLTSSGESGSQLSSHRSRFHVKRPRPRSTGLVEPKVSTRRTYRCHAPCHPCQHRMDRHRWRCPRPRTTCAVREESAKPTPTMSGPHYRRAASLRLAGGEKPRPARPKPGRPLGCGP